MVTILRNLRIDEVSSVDQGAGEGVKIVLMKRHDDTPLTLALRNAAQSFHDRKRRIAEQLMADEARLAAEAAREKPKPKPTTKESRMSRSEEMVEMKKFVSQPGGRTSFAKHIVAKGETNVNETEYVELWKAAAGGSTEFTKEFAEPRNARHEAYDIIRNTSHSQSLYAITGDARYAKVAPMMGVEVVSVEVGDTLVSDDSAAAVQQLNDIAEQQKITFEQAAVKNRAIFERTYTTAHGRPNVSSPSHAELQRSRS